MLLILKPHSLDLFVYLYVDTQYSCESVPLPKAKLETLFHVCDW